MTKDTGALYQKLVEDQEQLFHGIPQDPEWKKIRLSAWEDFRKLGFPTTRHEDWRYTNILPFLQTPYQIAGKNGVHLNASSVDGLDLPGLDAWRIVLVNGVLHQELCRLPQEGPLRVLPLEEAAALPEFRKHFSRYIDTANNHFAALNTAFASTGLFLELGTMATASKPVHLLHLTTGSSPLLIQYRNLVVLQPQSSLTLVEHFVPLYLSGDVLVNSATEMVLCEGATADHFRIQNGNQHEATVNHTQVFQDASTRYNNHTFCLNGKFIRNNTHVTIGASGGESHLYGLYITGGDQLVDNHTFVDHRKPGSQSNEWYKGVMKDRSAGVFSGKIFVRPGAQKTNAFQQNNNILIGENATMNSKPELEIFADDVKCSHGSTTGQLDEEAAFYLRTRGIGQQTARSMLVHAFAYDLTEKIRLEPLKRYINNLIDEKI